ncbi:ubiquitin-like-conjugating enzyme ATG10 [Ctenocephalides felis]|uniref:ubiquitin-like-conjugating enzyme ATG10 n=1 Tax=Ctenocephalides felis TaxID=7515 RepID=UPI000E6E4EA3|nr:ubiquitin-like-conjugating enzyme ATG10 [Ctenocephalides felis]
MTWEEFLLFAKDILVKSNELGDNWQLVGKDENYSQYLMKQEKHVCENENSHLEECDSNDFNDKSEATFNSVIVYNFEYHVTYNISYMVPVLSFNASKPDGTILTLDSAWKILLQNGVTDSSFHSILTQMDHPVLQIPFLTLHPCRTQELLGKFQKSYNLLLTFISVIGPYIGLRCDLRYGQTNDLTMKFDFAHK